MACIASYYNLKCAVNYLSEMDDELRSLLWRFVGLLALLALTFLVVKFDLHTRFADFVAPMLDPKK